MNEQLPAVTVEAIRQAVVEAGSSLHRDGIRPVSDFPARKDGLYLQQTSSEYAEFVHYMASLGTTFKLGLDVGIASGGQTKFLRDWCRIERTIVADLGTHHEFCHWERIKRSMRSELILELIGNSHSRQTYEGLRPYEGQVDFCFIDGDHSYAGVMRDIMLAHEVLAPNALMVLHDTVVVPDVARAYREIRAHPDFSLVRHFDVKFGITIFRCLRPAARKPYWRHWFAYGLGPKSVWKAIKRPFKQKKIAG